MAITLDPIMHSASSPRVSPGSFSTGAAGRSDSFGYGSLGGGIGAHGSEMHPVPSVGAPKQLNADEAADTGGPAGSLIGRGAHFVKGQMDGKGMPGMPSMGGGAGEGAEGAAGAGEAAGGIGDVLGELAPLALA
jgi:hypothetical protein